MTIIDRTWRGTTTQADANSLELVLKLAGDARTALALVATDLMDRELSDVTGVDMHTAQRCIDRIIRELTNDAD